MSIDTENYNTWLFTLDPEVRELVEKALSIEADGVERAKKAQGDWETDITGYLGWSANEVNSSDEDLLPLVYEGVIKISHDSGFHTRYLVVDPFKPESLTIPEGLFEGIIGHDRVKKLVTNSLTRALPVHFLLSGPPATAKSLFLEEVATLPESRYALGGSSSKVGIAEYLVMYRPRFLVIDELDKMKFEDFSVLLSLMQSGTIAILKRKKLVKAKVSTRVFAGANRKDKLPPEVLSRFIQFDFKPYTREEFVSIATQVMIRDFDKDIELAKYTAEEASKWTGDVRQVLQLAKLTYSKEEVDLYSEEMKERPQEVPAITHQKNGHRDVLDIINQEDLGITSDMTIIQCIYHLEDRGFERADIAKILGITYQKVRYELEKRR